MGKNSDLSPRKRGQIRVLLENTYLSQSEIARRVGVSQPVVSNIKQKMKQGGSGTPKRTGMCGRRRLSSKQDDRALVRLSKINRKKTSRSLMLDMSSIGVHMSTRTVRRRLFEAGLRAYRPRKKPKLTVAMRKKRLAWAKQFQSWTKEDWERVCFSDESTLEILGDSCRYVRRRPGEEFLDQCLVQRVKHPLKVMIWSVISTKGSGRLHVVDGIMNSEKYLELLQNRLVPQLFQWFPDGNCIYMQDGAPCHTARKVTGYFEEIGLELLPWPGNSPDMNPIEGLWHTLKEKVNSTVATNKRALIESIIDVWHRDPQIPNLIASYIASMPNRIKALLHAKGGSTKY
jgi:transposase